MPTYVSASVRYKTSQAKRAFDPLCDRKPNKRTKTEAKRTEPHRTATLALTMMPTSLLPLPSPSRRCIAAVKERCRCRCQGRTVPENGRVAWMNDSRTHTRTTAADGCRKKAQTETLASASLPSATAWVQNLVKTAVHKAVTVTFPCNTYVTVYVCVYACVCVCEDII